MSSLCADESAASTFPYLLIFVAHYHALGPSPTWLPRRQLATRSRPQSHHPRPTTTSSLLRRLRLTRSSRNESDARSTSGWLASTRQFTSSESSTPPTIPMQQSSTSNMARESRKNY